MKMQPWHNARSHNRIWGDPLPGGHRLSIKTRSGKVVATLSGSDPDELQARAERMARAYSGEVIHAS